MSTILISSHDGDAHAAAIAWGLRALGRPACLWQAHLFPASQALSIAFEPSGPVRHAIEGEGPSLELEDVATVWNRRPGPPQLRDGVDTRDRAFALAESEQHLAGFLATACRGALWVNPPAATAFDTDKAGQLLLAGDVGFTIPATLASNSPERIRAFFVRQGGRIVYKSYRRQHWWEGDGKPVALTNYTAPVSERDLRNDRALAICPGLFQQRIDKAFELRVTIMGNSFFAARIDPPDEARDAIDWRPHRSRIRLSPFSLTDEFKARCRAYMRRAGLVFGCFDFIVSKDGEWFFLEVNPMGQFLWKEELAPELPMLDAMCAFLASGDPDFAWRPSASPLTFADYRAWEAAERSRIAPGTQALAEPPLRASRGRRS
jgi:glutathione synthase/RimK-type ligase-like ATP-grasp enzyme